MASSTTSVRKAAAPTVQQEMERIRGGVKFRSVQNLQKALQVPMATIAAVLGMSRATLHRRKLQGKIDKNESERLVRYERLLKRATNVLGDSDNARQWLTQPQPGLGNAVPIQFAASEVGAREVENLLGRLEYSVYS